MNSTLFLADFFGVSDGTFLHWMLAISLTLLVLDVFCNTEVLSWLSMLVLRLQDEPHLPDYWKWARKIAAEVCPGVPCGEPLDTHAIAVQLAGECNQYVPRLEVYASDPFFYRERQKAGDTVWCYSCCFPEENWWLNKFIDLPHSYAQNTD